MSLESVAHLIVAHGYAVLFVVIALDCLILPIPGELLLLTFGGIAVQAHLDLGVGVLVAALAVLVGESISYWAGRLGGERAFAKLRFAQRWRLGTTIIIFGRFAVGARILLAPLAGARRLPFGRFLLFDALGAMLWASLFVMVGYGARVNLAAVQRHWTNVANTIEIVLVLALATYLGAKLARLPRLPIAIGIALIVLAALRPATAASQEVYVVSPRGNHDPLRLIPVEMSGPSRVQLFPMP